VLDGGRRVVEVGTHAELLAAGGLYASQWAVFSGEPMSEAISAELRVGGAGSRLAATLRNGFRDARYGQVIP